MSGFQSVDALVVDYLIIRKAADSHKNGKGGPLTKQILTIKL